LRQPIAYRAPFFSAQPHNARPLLGFRPWGWMAHVPWDMGERERAMTKVTAPAVAGCGILEVVPKSDQRDYIDWDEGREGYIDRPVVAYVPVPKSAVTPVKPAKKQQHSLSVQWEVRVASLIAAAGAIWAVYVATVDYTSLWRVQIMPPGPVEVCALGVLAWLHAKWRRSAQVR